MEIVGGTVLLAMALVAYIIYAQAFSADWTFDDARSLEGLDSVQDMPSAIAFLTSPDRVSITGRPVAMASFFLNLDDWPHHPSGFRHLSTLIHILNSLLLALITLRIGRMIPRLAPHAIGFSVTLTVSWLALPLLASTSLMIIQRMTLLAATWTLLGTLAYLHGRTLLAIRPAAGYAWMSGGLVVATLIGTFAKENAALTPLLIACLEFMILSIYAPIVHPRLRLWRLLFFGMPALALGVYMIYYMLAGWDGNGIRPFSQGQRLLSESVIMFEYIRQMFIPDVNLLGPYQDEYSRIRSFDALTLLSSAAWLALITLALAIRRRWPVAAFSVLFYCTGHLLESTVFNLELYFEHRNYLASLGLVGGLIGAAWASDYKWPKIASAVYAAIMAALLWKMTTLWGDPIQSAHTWAKMHPTSPRASQNLATLYQRRGNYAAAARIILDSYRRMPRDGVLALQAVSTLCFTDDKSQSDNILDAVTRDAPVLYMHNRVILALHGMIDLNLKGHCDAYDPERAIVLTEALLRNPGARSAASKYGLLFALARAQELAGHKQQAIQTKLLAFSTLPSIESATTIFFQLHEAGRTEEARSFITKARISLPEYEDYYRAWTKYLANSGNP
jgi:tetratricopeptide (TPR) repeat protein